MSVKRAFFSIFQKIMVICCAIFFGFANAFSANLPSGYTELEYIESTGTQYIDTGKSTLFGANPFVIRTRIATNAQDSFRAVFGNRADPSSSDGLAIYLTPQRGVIYYSRGANNEQRVSPTDFYNNEFHDIVMNYFGNANGNFIIDGITYPVSTTSANVDRTDVNYFVFRNAGNLYYKGKIAYLTMIGDNNNELMNLISARRNSDGKVGMYDTVSGTFFTNSGTGEFTAGPVVPENPIKIATTAYNTARFNPVKTDLDSAVATIREIVTKTINQTAAIASLQADKQTRPEEQCPAGKKCLLVETEENGVIVPHWFPIIESADD